MRKLVLVSTSAVLLAMGAIGMGALPLAAQVAPPPIATEFLTPRSVFPDDIALKVKFFTDDETEVVKVLDPSRTVTARITIQPGAQFPWHSHAGPVVVNVAEGTLTFVETDCSERSYPVGNAFIDPGHGHVHTAYNPTGGVTVIVATFFEAPAEGSLLIPADPPACAA